MRTREDFPKFILQIITKSLKIPPLTCCLSCYHYSNSDNMLLAVPTWQPVEQWCVTYWLGGINAVHITNNILQLITL